MPGWSVDLYNSLAPFLLRLVAFLLVCRAFDPASSHCPSYYVGTLVLKVLKDWNTSSLFLDPSQTLPPVCIQPWNYPHILEYLAHATTSSEKHSSYSNNFCLSYLLNFQYFVWDLRAFIFTNSIQRIWVPNFNVKLSRLPYCTPIQDSLTVATYRCKIAQDKPLSKSSIPATTLSELALILAHSLPPGFCSPSFPTTRGPSRWAVLGVSKA